MTSQTIVVYENSVTPAPPASGYRSAFPVADGWKEIDSAGVARYFARLDTDDASLTVAGGVRVGVSTGLTGATGRVWVADGTRQLYLSPRTSVGGTGLVAGYDLGMWSNHVLNLFGSLSAGNSAGGVNIAYYNSVSLTWNAAIEIRNAAGLGTLKLMQDGGSVNIGGGLNVGTATGAVTGAWRTKVATGEQLWVRPPADFGAGYGIIIQAVDSAGTASAQLVLAGSLVRILNDLRLDISTAAGATAGGGAALPATVAGFIIVNIGGTSRKIPYYAT